MVLLIVLIIILISYIAILFITSYNFDKLTSFLFILKVVNQKYNSFNDEKLMSVKNNIQIFENCICFILNYKKRQINIFCLNLIFFFMFLLLGFIALIFVPQENVKNTYLITILLINLFFFIFFAVYLFIFVHLILLYFKIKNKLPIIKSLKSNIFLLKKEIDSDFLKTTFSIHLKRKKRYMSRFQILNFEVFYKEYKSIIGETLYLLIFDLENKNKSYYSIYSPEIQKEFESYFTYANTN
ncbi:Uncharacterised protein [Mycoplasmopsis columboralis]|uniref:Transmembrane protein n=1 Tax=Mycoplasmopsis columboralis TaxID=171282 RepID=A0A449B5Z2_9BACT|nr:Uncharacterised protein [Mycoplasmopsis columboralis]